MGLAKKEIAFSSPLKGRTFKRTVGEGEVEGEMVGEESSRRRGLSSEEVGEEKYQERKGERELPETIAVWGWRGREEGGEEGEEGEGKGVVRHEKDFGKERDSRAYERSPQSPSIKMNKGMIRKEKEKKKEKEKLKKRKKKE